jgi:hypothetical protein
MLVTIPMIPIFMNVPLNNFFWPKIFTTNTLCENLYKMYECDNNQMPYCNVKKPLKDFFWEILDH